MDKECKSFSFHLPMKGFLLVNGLKILNTHKHQSFLDIKGLAGLNCYEVIIIIHLRFLRKQRLKEGEYLASFHVNTLFFLNREQGIIMQGRAQVAVSWRLLKILVWM